MAWGSRLRVALTAAVVWGVLIQSAVVQRAALAQAPVDVGEPDGAMAVQPVSMISAGGDSTCAVTAGGGVSCWGSMWGGRLGNGVDGGQSVLPVTPNGLSSGMVFVNAGSEHACAVSASGGVKCWGKNTWGQVGDGGGGQHCKER